MKKIMSRLGPYGSVVALVVLALMIGAVTFAIAQWEHGNSDAATCRRGVEATLKDGIKRTQQGQPPGGVEAPIPACMKLPPGEREDIYNDLVKQYFDDLVRAGLTSSPTP